MLNYDEIVENMRNDFFEKAGYTADEASDIGIRIRVLAGEIYNLQSYAEWIKRQAFPQTAVGEYLDYHAQTRGIERKIAKKSVGILTFSVPEPSENDIEIPLGTIVSTAGENPISFITTEYAVINSEESSVDVNAEAVCGGTSGNIPSNMVSVIVTMTADNLTVKNTHPFTLGTDDESDETLRARVMNSMKFIINGTNREYYSSLAKTINGVECVNVVPCKFGRGTVVVYVSGKRAKLAQSIVDEVKNILVEQREINLAIYVYSADIKNVIIEASVNLEDGYSMDEIKKEIFNNLSELLDSFSVGVSLQIAQINDIFYHTEGIKSFTIMERGTSGINAEDRDKLVLKVVNLRENGQ